MGRIALRRDMLRKSAVTIGVVMLSGCDPYPRDISGTTDRIAGSHSIRTGIVAGPMSQPDRAVVDRFLASLEKQTGARVVRSTNGAEASMMALDHAQLDLVVGAFADDTPWRNKAAVLEPLRHEQAKQKSPVVRAIIRNGENRWIMKVEQVIRDQASGA